MIQRNRNSIGTILLAALIGVVLLATPMIGSAHELNQWNGIDAEFEPDRHSISGFIIPALVWNQVHLAYEYKVSERIGIRADSGALLFMGGGAVLGSVGLSVQVAQSETSSGVHSLELDVAPMLYAYGAGHCDISVHDCGGSSGLGARGFVGYRYQSHDGFQARIGFAPMVFSWDQADGLGIAGLPELTLGYSF